MESPTNTNGLDLSASAEETPQAGTDRFVLIARLLAMGILLLLTLRVFVYTPDDAFITYRYSYNLAHGFGPVFNPGAPISDRTEGYSCPLFMLLMALFHKVSFGMDILLLAKFFGLACGLGMLVVVQKLAEAMKLPRWTQILAPLLLAIHPSFVNTNVDGMETAFVALLVSLATLTFLREFQACEAGSDKRVGVASAGLFAACALTRPEGLVLGLMALGILVAGRLGKFGKREIRWIVTFLLPVAAWFLWRFSFYGFWVPNTYYAKQAPVIDAFTKGVAYLARMFPSLLNDKPIFYALAAIWWLLIVVGMFSERFRRPPTLMVPLLVVGQMIFVLRAGGDWMGGWRYMCPVLPLIFLLTMTALVDIMEGCLRLRGSLGKVLAQGAIGIACLTLVLGSYWGHQDFWATPYIGYLSWSSKGFSFQQRKLLQGWMLQKAVTVSDWLNTHVPAGSVVAYSEMGATTYFSPQLRFLDVDGLTDHGVATLPGVKHEQIGVRDPYITMNGVVGPYLLHERKPDYILQGLGLRSGQSSAQFSILNDVYEFVDAFPTPPSDTPGVQVYMAVWKRRS